MLKQFWETIENSVNFLKINTFLNRSAIKSSIWNLQTKRIGRWGRVHDLPLYMTWSRLFRLLMFRNPHYREMNNRLPDCGLVNWLKCNLMMRGCMQFDVLYGSLSNNRLHAYCESRRRQTWVIWCSFLMENACVPWGPWSIWTFVYAHVAHTCTCLDLAHHRQSDKSIWCFELHKHNLLNVVTVCPLLRLICNRRHNYRHFRIHGNLPYSLVRVANEQW